MSSSRDPWRHVILTACALSLFFCPSFNASHGVLLVALTDTGLYDVNTVTWLLSFSNLMFSFGGPVVSILTNWISCRTCLILSGLGGFLGPTLASCTSDIRIIFVTYGVLSGLARGMILSTAVLEIGYWFKEGSSIAYGLMYAGAGAGMLVHPSLIQALVDQYDADGALLLMGAIGFHTCICGLLLRQSHFETERRQTLKKEKHKQLDVPFKKRVNSVFVKFKSVILTNYSFLFFVLGIYLMRMSISIIITFMPHYINSKGSTPQEAAMAASIFGAGSLIARVLAGIMTNDPNIGTLLLFDGNCGIAATFCLFYPLMVQTVAGRYIYAFAMGIYLNCLVVIGGPTTLQKVGLENLAYGFGFLLLSAGIASLIAPPIAVQVKYLAESYDAVFILAGCLLFGACLSGCLSELFKKADLEKENQAPEEFLPKAINVDELEDITEENTSNDALPFPVLSTGKTYSETSI